MPTASTARSRTSPHDPLPGQSPRIVLLARSTIEVTVATATRPDRTAAPLRPARLPRFLHPLAWWAWALGLMVAAARTTNPLLLGLLLAVLAVVVAARRPDAAWAGSFAAALRLGGVVIVVRLVLQVLLGAPVGAGIAFTLPEVTLPDWMAGVRLGGIVTWGSIVIGLCEGLRLSVMIACVGAANSLAAASRLLRSVPAALYELGVANLRPGKCREPERVAGILVAPR